LILSTGAFIVLVPPLFFGLRLLPSFSGFKADCRLSGGRRAVENGSALLAEEGIAAAGKGEVTVGRDHPVQ
jgi:hypothetical protein